MSVLRKRRFATAAMVVATFGAGFVVARVLPENFAAHAQSTPAMAPQVINVIEIKDGDLNPVPNSAGNFNKTYVTADSATISVQTGNVAKHLQIGRAHV